MGKDGKKGLGMGLGALFGEEYPAPQPEREETAPDLLPIEKIEPRAASPATDFTISWAILPACTRPCWPTRAIS